MSSPSYKTRPRSRHPNAGRQSLGLNEMGEMTRLPGLIRDPLSAMPLGGPRLEHAATRLRGVHSSPGRVRHVRPSQLFHTITCLPTGCDRHQQEVQLSP